MVKEGETREYAQWWALGSIVSGGVVGRDQYLSAKGRVEYQLSTKKSVKQRVWGTWVPPDTRPAFAWVLGCRV